MGQHLQGEDEKGGGQGKAWPMRTSSNDSYTVFREVSPLGQSEKKKKKKEAGKR